MKFLYAASSSLSYHPSFLLHKINEWMKKKTFEKLKRKNAEKEDSLSYNQYKKVMHYENNRAKSWIFLRWQVLLSFLENGKEEKKSSCFFWRIPSKTYVAIVADTFHEREKALATVKILVWILRVLKACAYTTREEIALEFLNLLYLCACVSMVIIIQSQSSSRWSSFI